MSFGIHILGINRICRKDYKYKNNNNLCYAIFHFLFLPINLFVNGTPSILLAMSAFRTKINAANSKEEMKL
jgi:hypothetical protein